MKKMVLFAFFAAGFITVSLPTLAQETKPAQDKPAQNTADQDKTAKQLLDEAEELKIKAETIVQQKTVIDLLEKAIAKGLDEADAKFAKQLLVDALFRRAE